MIVIKTYQFNILILKTGMGGTDLTWPREILVHS